MKRIIAKLREKPDEHKQMVAFATSLVITLFVFGIWVSTLSFGDVAVVATETQKKLQDGITPLATVKASFDSIVTEFQKLKSLER